MIYEIKNEHLTVQVSSRGAEMQSVLYGGKEYLWTADPAWWAEHAPVLFPYVGRFTEGKYRLNGREYEMKIHGFASVSEFSLYEKTGCSVTLELKDTPELFAAYPYHFILRVTYMLDGNSIRIFYYVRNLSDGTMYFGIGGHPGFNVPFEAGTSFEDYFLEFSAAHTPTRIGQTEACFLNGIDTDFPLRDGRILPLRHDLFDEDAIILKNVADEVTLKSKTGSRSVTVSYPNLPYLGLWHAPKTEAPYLCIEPWSTLPSRQDIIEDFRFKSDMNRLVPEDEYKNTWSITFA